MPFVSFEVLDKGSVIINKVNVSMGDSKELEVPEKVIEALKNMEKKGVIKIKFIEETAEPPEQIDVIAPTEEEIKAHFEVGGSPVEEEVSVEAVEEAVEEAEDTVEEDAEESEDKPKKKSRKKK